MNVEKFCDELWGGVKGQSDWEISRSLRNSFWASLTSQTAGVERLDGNEVLTRCSFQPNSEYCGVCRGSKSAGDNLRGQKGKNPDRQLRSQITSQFERRSGSRDSQDVGLEAATI